MRRWIVAGLLLVLVLTGCSNPDQKLRENAAQTAREAMSEVNTTRLAVEQLRSHRLWPQPAEQIVKDSEKSLGKAASGFSSQQPTTAESTRVYEQTTKALGDAQDAVTAVRIALGNDDLTAAERQLDPLRRSGSDLQRIGELAK